MTPMLERKRLRPAVQFFQPLSHFIAARFRNMAMLTVRGTDSQDEQQIARPTSLVHNPPHGIQVIRLRECCVSTGGTCSSKKRPRDHAPRCGCRFNKIDVKSGCAEVTRTTVASSSFLGRDFWVRKRKPAASSQQTPSPLHRLLLPRPDLRPPRPLRSGDSLPASSRYGALAPLRCD